MLAARARAAELYREALAGIEGLRAALRGQRRRRARLVRVRRAAAAPAAIATRQCARSRRSGIQSKPYLPAIHLMSFYRERFGHREGEFPVCEDVAARSLALPFFPQISEGQVERVAERSRERLGQRALASRRAARGGAGRPRSTRLRPCPASTSPSTPTSSG